MTERSLADRAAAVLEGNRVGAWTVPAPGVYPHQWMWDSCFVAIGLARRHPARAAGELRALLRGQWSNGMVPHMVFAPGRADRVGRHLWSSRRDPRAPRAVDTSCITQPPLLAVAAVEVVRRLPASDRAPFLEDVVPKIVAHHRWLYRERDVDGSGLVALLHPWECGLDTSPPWMHVLARVEDSLLVRATRVIRVARLARLVRRDTRFIPAGQRSSDDDGLRMLLLVRRLRRYAFDASRLPPSCPRIQDVSFNALLVVADRALGELTDEAGIELDPWLVERSRATRASLELLWSDRYLAYCARDATTGALIGPPTVANFVALWAGVRADRAELVARALDEPRWSPPVPVPSVALDAAEFESHRYWKGPTWVNTNWLVVQGLEAIGAGDAANRLRTRTLEVVDAHGFAEYFCALDGTPLGARDFSWTAALVLALEDGTDPGSA